MDKLEREASLYVQLKSELVEPFSTPFNFTYVFELMFMSAQVPYCALRKLPL